MNPQVIPIHGNREESRLVRATVKEVSNQTLIIEIENELVNARKAFSCLVAPMVGDTVLLNQSADEYHVLAVLERPAEQDMTLAFPSNVKMVASGGQIDLVAGNDINLLSTSRTNLVSGNINMSSGELDISTANLNLRARDIEAHSQTVKLYTDILATVAKQVSQKTGMLVRWVEGVETLNIGSLIQNVRQNYMSRSHQAVITARKDMHIDAERIHMG